MYRFFKDFRKIKCLFHLKFVKIKLCLLKETICSETIQYKITRTSYRFISGLGRLIPWKIIPFNRGTRHRHFSGNATQPMGIQPITVH